MINIFQSGEINYRNFSEREYLLHCIKEKQAAGKADELAFHIFNEKQCKDCCYRVPLFMSVH